MIGTNKNIYIWEHASKKTNGKNTKNIFLIRKTLRQRGAHDTLTNWIHFTYLNRNRNFLIGRKLDDKFVLMNEASVIFSRPLPQITIGSP